MAIIEGASWFGILALIVLPFLMTGSVTANDSRESLSSQLSELRVMITGLNVKLSSVESLASDVKILDYAFKVNSVDRHLQQIDSRMTHLTTQVDSMKDSIKTLEQTCGQQSSPAGRTTGGAEKEKTSDKQMENLMEKLDNYGTKMIRGHQELMNSGEQRHNATNRLLEVVRTGFTKSFQKLDSMLTMEGQMSAMTATLSGLAPRLSQISQQLVDVTDDISDVKNNIGPRESLQILEIADDVSTISKNVASIKTTLEDLPLGSSQDNGDVSAKIAPALSRSLDITNVMKTEFDQIEELRPKITEAKAIAENTQSARISTEEDQNLKKLVDTLKMMESSLLPMFSVIPQKVSDMQKLLRDALSSIDNKTTCNFQEVFRVELNRINSIVDQCGRKDLHGESSTDNPKIGDDNRTVYNNLHLARSIISQVHHELRRSNCSISGSPSYDRGFTVDNYRRRYYPLELNSGDFRQPEYVERRFRTGGFGTGGNK